MCPASGRAGAIGVHVVPHVVLRRSRAVLVIAPVVLILIQRHVVAWAMIIRLNHVDQKNAQRHYQRVNSENKCDSALSDFILECVNHGHSYLHGQK